MKVWGDYQMKYKLSIFNIYCSTFIFLLVGTTMELLTWMNCPEQGRFIHLTQYFYFFSEFDEFTEMIITASLA